MTGKAKQKGDRVEREIQKILEDYGLKVERSLLRAQAGKEVDWDLLVEDDLAVEIKARKDGQGFATLDRWMGDCDLLVLKQNRKAPMVYMPLTLFAGLVRKYYGRE